MSAPRLAERSEPSAFPADLVDDPEQVQGRARQPIELGHHQHVAGLKLVEHTLQLRPPGSDARHLLAEDARHAGGLEQDLLGRESLPGRADAGVSVNCHFTTACFTVRPLIPTPLS